MKMDENESILFFENIFLLLFSCILISTFGCVSSRTLGTLPTNPQDFNLSQNDIKAQFPEISIYEKDKLKNIFGYCTPVKDVITLWGEPDEKIISAEAYLVPAPPELYQAVAGKTLTETEIRKIIEDDMKANAESPETDPMVKAMIADFDPKLMSLRKFLIPKPPYVIYEVHTVWGYTINALTGEILEKVPVRYITNGQVPDTININLKQDASSLKGPRGIKKETKNILLPQPKTTSKKIQIDPVAKKPLPTRSLKKQEGSIQETSRTISKEPNSEKVKFILEIVNK